MVTEDWGRLMKEAPRCSRSDLALQREQVQPCPHPGRGSGSLAGSRQDREGGRGWWSLYYSLGWGQCSKEKHLCPHQGIPLLRCCVQRGSLIPHFTAKVAKSVPQIQGVGDLDREAREWDLLDHLPQVPLKAICRYRSGCL